MWVCSAKLKMFVRKTVFLSRAEKWDIHSADDLVMCLCYFNEHIEILIDLMSFMEGIAQVQGRIYKEECC